MAADDPPAPSKYEAVDANGVDLLSGQLAIPGQSVNSIGDGIGGLTATERVRYGAPLSSQLSYVRLTRDSDFNFHTTVVLLGATETFSGKPDIGAESDSQTSGEIHVEGNEFVYTQIDGSVARFTKVTIGTTGGATQTGYLKSVVYPSGERLTANITYNTSMYLESSLGYALTGALTLGRWSPVAANLKQAGCSAGACSGTTYASQIALGRVPSTSYGSSTLVVTPASGGASRTYTFNTDKRVVSVTDGTSTWTYAYSENVDTVPRDSILTTTATDPLGHVRIVKTRTSTQHILSDTNAVGKVTTFQYSQDAARAGLGLLTQITWPEGNKSRYEYDAKYNVTTKWEDAKPGSGLTSTSVQASYSYGAGSVCATAKVCNKPDWIKDARGNQTDFTYDPTHGGVLTVTRPAGPNGVRPQTRYTYGQFTARYYVGSVLTAAAPVWRVTKTSTCQTLAACAGTADEIVTTYAYESSSVANNVRLLSTTVASGDGTLSATTANTYNDRGDVIAVDGPLAGTADTTWSYYDASRWKTGMIGPDPDGAGPLRYRATRSTYNADGKVTLAETGTATSQGDGAMSTFSPLKFERSTYDALGRLAKVEEGQP